VHTPPALSKPPVVKGGGAGRVKKLAVTPIVKGTGPVVKRPERSRSTTSW